MKVTFSNWNKTVEAAPGDTVLDVAIQNDIPLQHACGGFCSCTTCHVLVESGANNLEPMEEEEQERMGDLDNRRDNSRLGCQSRIVGDIVLRVPDEQ